LCDRMLCGVIAAHVALLTSTLHMDNKPSFVKTCLVVPNEGYCVDRGEIVQLMATKQMSHCTALYPSRTRTWHTCEAVLEIQHL
jgi:hypothetical protein